MGINQGLEPPGRDHAAVLVTLRIWVHEGLVAPDYDSLEEGHRGDCGGHALDEVDAVLLRPPLEDAAVGGLRDVLHGEVPLGVVADRVDGDPVPLVECRPIPASEASYSCRRLSRASRTSVYDVSTDMQPTQDLGELIGCVE